MKEAPNIWNKMQTPRLQLNLFVQVGSHHEPSLHTESQRGDCLTHSHQKKTLCPVAYICADNTHHAPGVMAETTAETTAETAAAARAHTSERRSLPGELRPASL